MRRRTLPTMLLSALVGPMLVMVPTTTSPAEAVTVPAAATPVTVSVSPTEDAMVVSSMPWSNFGGYDQLSSQTGTDPVETFLKFDLPAAPTGTTLAGASLSVRTSSDATAASTGSFPVTVSTGSWTESTVNWNNRPTGSGARVGTLTGATSTNTSYSAAMSVDVLAANLGTTTSLRLGSTATDNLRVLSQDIAHAPYRPSLTLTFAPTASTAPTPTPTPTPTPAPAPAASPTGKRVFAHYMPSYPISFENKTTDSDYYTRNYLTIDGENGIWRYCGGLLRDRPAGRSPLGSDFLLQDMRTEVRQAKAAGIDGFTLNVMGLYGMNWTASVNLMKAAQLEGGFKIIPNIDATASVANEAPATIAAKMAELYRYGSGEMAGGEFVLSSFAAEVKGASWFNQVVSSLESTQGMPIKFIAVFLDATTANMDAFSSISYGYGNWGVRNADLVARAADFSARAHARGKKWMEPVAFQDARPRSGVYAESNNTENGRAMWKKAIEQDADYVQVVTWNDYSESTQVAPSRSHGSVFLDISEYYISWLKNGVAPSITADQLFVTHRIHPAGAQPTSGIRNMSSNLGGMTAPPRDTAEALVFLTSPAQVAISSGGSGQSFSLPAGVSSVTVPLRAGNVAARIYRGTTVSRIVESPFTVTNSPSVQDFQYWAAGG